MWFIIIGLVNILTGCSFPAEGIQNHAREQSQGLGFRVLGLCFRAFALLPAVLTYLANDFRLEPPKNNGTHDHWTTSILTCEEQCPISIVPLK